MSLKFAASLLLYSVYVPDEFESPFKFKALVSLLRFGMYCVSFHFRE